MSARRWLVRTVVGVAVVLVLRTAWLVGEREWRRAEGEKAYAAAAADTDRTDPDWRWDDLNAKRPRPPADRNSADVIAGLKGRLPAGWGLKLEGDDWKEFVSIPANVRFPDAVLADARRQVDDARPAVETLRTLKDYPDEGFRELVLTPDVIGTRLDDTQRTRFAVVVLRWDAAVAAADGDAGRVADDLLAALNASRSIGDEPFLISQVVRISCRSVAARALERALAQVDLGEPRLAALQAAWAADAERPILLFGFRGDRAAWDAMLGNLIDGTYRPRDGSAGPGGWFGDSSWWLYRVRFWEDRAYLLDYLTRAVEVARRPAHEQPRLLADLPPPPGDDLRMAQLFLPAVEKVARSYWRSLAEARCVVTGLACERFRLRHGRWPESLAELPKDLLAEVPLDPFDGRPLRFRRLPDGVVVYSVGENATDDGGEVRDPANPDGKDEGFRLWDPDHRRQPPPPGPPAEPDPPPDPEEP